jgi:hypothetical protein
MAKDGYSVTTSGNLRILHARYTITFAANCMYHFGYFKFTFQRLEHVWFIFVFRQIRCNWGSTALFRLKPQYLMNFLECYLEFVDILQMSLLVSYC